jgi:hypothetical protein
MKILMLVPLWGRPEIVRLFVRRMEESMPEYAELILFFAPSLNDEDEEELFHITKGYTKYYTGNFPLGKKKNEAMKLVSCMEWDYLMDMGSDNIWTPKLWDYLKPYFDKQSPFFGINNLYVYNTLTDEAVFLDGYNNGSAIGPGRCISRELVMRCLPLWPDQHHGLDGASAYKIKKLTGIVPEVIDVGHDPVMLDIKSDVCLTGWHEICDNEPIEVDWLKNEFKIKL